MNVFVYELLKDKIYVTFYFGTHILNLEIIKCWSILFTFVINNGKQFYLEITGINRNFKHYSTTYLEQFVHRSNCY